MRPRQIGRRGGRVERTSWNICTPFVMCGALIDTQSLQMLAESRQTVATIRFEISNAFDAHNKNDSAELSQRSASEGMRSARKMYVFVW